MKLLKYFLSIAVFFTISTVSAQEINDKWKQMRDYYELLSKTFHPAEEGNLNPIINSSSELLAKAELLDITSMPKDLRTPKVEEIIIILKKQTKVVDDLVKSKAPKAELMRAFENLHDVFHRIVQLSQPER